MTQRTDGFIAGNTTLWTGNTQVHAQLRLGLHCSGTIVIAGVVTIEHCVVRAGQELRHCWVQAELRCLRHHDHGLLATDHAHHGTLVSEVVWCGGGGEEQVVDVVCDWLAGETREQQL